MRPAIPGRLWVVITGATLAAAVLGTIAWDHAPHAEVLTTPWLAIAAAFFVVESFPIHVHYRREATSFSLLEVPMLLGIVGLSGGELLTAVGVGTALALALVRRQPLVKILFNVPNFIMQASAAIIVFDLIAPESGLSPSFIAAALIAGLVASVLSSTAIAIVIRVAEGTLDLAKTTSLLVFSAVLGLTNSSLATIAVKLGEVDQWAAALLVVPVAVAALAYRAFVSERHQREQVQFLHSATKSLHSDLVRSDAVEVLVSETANMFRSSRVELVLFESSDPADGAVHCSAGVDGVNLVDLDPASEAAMRALAATLTTAERLLPSRHGAMDRWLLESGFREALVMPLATEDTQIGLFVVGDRIGAVVNFADADLELFSALGVQIGTALENDRLGQALHDLRSLEGELSHQAVHDSLTGLPNRLGLRRHLEQLVVSSTSADLLFIDLDDFKLVNDTLGHSSGDQLLAEVGARVQSCLGPNDFAARLGGDEFAVAVEVQGRGAHVADCIVKAVGEPMNIDSTVVAVGCSIGIAKADPSRDVATMLRRADVAMYASKSAGKNRVTSYTDRLGDDLLERQRLRHQIREAVDHGDLRLLYQPIFEAGSDGQHIRGVEALVRWSESGDLHSPSVFLAVAEESGFVTRIDRWVFEQVIADRAELAHLGWTSLNMSARHLHEDDVVEWIVETTRAGGVDPQGIVIEITETAAMSDIDASIEKLRQLRAHGFRVALDDFGTGYSSIAYLRRLPVSMLKIAQPFVADLSRDGAPAFVKVMIDLSHTLKLPVVAEGVETLDQLVALRRMGCDFVQGFLLGTPVGLEELRNLSAPGPLAAPEPARSEIDAGGGRP